MVQKNGEKRIILCLSSLAIDLFEKSIGLFRTHFVLPVHSLRTPCGRMLYPVILFAIHAFLLRWVWFNRATFEKVIKVSFGRVRYLAKQGDSATGRSYVFISDGEVMIFWSCIYCLWMVASEWLWFFTIGLKYSFVRLCFQLSAVLLVTSLLTPFPYGRV